MIGEPMQTPSVTELQPTTAEDAEAARARIRGTAIRTPLLRLDMDGPVDIHLKLENLQPIGSYKLRGAANRMLQLPEAALREGVWTASAGNMAQGVAWCARLAGVPCTVVVPQNASEAKLAAVRRLGARIETVSRDEFFEIFAARERPGLEGLFIHAFSDPAVMAGNGTIALEILEDLPDVRAIYVPYGGGGLSCGIAGVLRSAAPHVRVIACEPETAAPLAASLAGGIARATEHRPSFVDGAGAPRVYPEMFALARELIAEARAVPLHEVAAALRLLAERAHVIAEGAGGLGVAVALQHAHEGPVACVVSGGNIRADWLSAILSGQLPSV